MRNLTFEEKLIREHRPEPLEGHHVVVLERVGEAGEKFHSVLEPGDAGPRRRLISKLLGKPSLYFAFAVDATKSRLLSFSEPVMMAERGREFELHFSLWYRVSNPQLLVSMRERDPLDRVRKKVAEVVTEEVAELSWADVWESPRASSEKVLLSTLHDLRSFARDYGIGITSLRLRPRFDSEIHTVHAPGQLGQARLDVKREIQRHRSSLRRENAEREEEDRPNAMRKRLHVTTVDKLEELLGSAGRPSDLEHLTGMLGGSPAIHGAGTGKSSAGDVLFRVWYATNRRQREARTGIVYGGRLDSQVHFGSCDVLIPESHEIGSLGSPWLKRIWTRTDDPLRLEDVVPLQEEIFWARLRHAAAQCPADQRDALVFVHGYRVSFKDAALRTAQLGYDLGVRGPVAFFSWPSRGRLLAYTADSAAVEASEKPLTRFLIDFCKNSGANRVHVIAHSMGNRPLLRALQNILSQAKEESAVRFGQLILAAPDITRELFLDVAEQYKRLSHRTTLYISDEDRALRTSFRLQGPRVGLAPPVTCVDGIDTVHVANVDRTLLGHSTFAEARPVLTDMHALLHSDTPPDRRMGLIARHHGDDRYWEIRA